MKKAGRSGNCVNHMAEFASIYPSVRANVDQILAGQNPTIQMGFRAGINMMNTGNYQGACDLLKLLP